MKIRHLIAGVLTLGMAFTLVILHDPLPLRAQPADYEKLRTEGERLYEEHSYMLAHDAYEKAQKQKLTPEDERWVQFRLADTLWRAQAGTDTPDATKYDQARTALQALLDTVKRDIDRDRVWAETAESLGDFFWDRRGRSSQDWVSGWRYYQPALDWWAGARDLELARSRYLHIVWTMTRPAWADRSDYSYGDFANNVPLPILENAVNIAVTPQDKSHAHYLLAMTLRNYGGDMSQRKRIPAEFEAALQGGKANEWYDDALFSYAEWMMQQGPVVAVAQQAIVGQPRQPRQWRQQPDYVKALALYRRLLNEFKDGETRYYEQAKNRVAEITGPTVSVSVANIFLPDSEIQYNVNWRNIKRLDFALYPVDLTTDVKFKAERRAEDWLQTIDLTAAEPVRTWAKDTGDKGEYTPGSATWRVEEKLKPGAYVLEAKGEGKKAREIVLVTDATAVLKSVNTQAVVYACDALNGAPLPAAQVTLWEGRYAANDKYDWRLTTRQADKDGLCRFELRDLPDNNRLFTVVKTGARQAFCVGYNSHRDQDGAPWRIYAFTDRPAYRPGEQAQWKFIARRYANGVYTTPADQTIEYEISDPRGTKVKADKATLNAFGSYWTTVNLTDSMPLGEYRVTFYEVGRNRTLGNATLFRLEEYKLPEFKVSVKTPEENGKRKSFKLGDRVEVSVLADYYFGGPVANATAEVIIYQKAFAQQWSPRRDYPWYYEDMTPRYRDYGYRGAIIKREVLKTDATGKATLAFDTPQSGNDLEFRIEARVTDASRREIVGADAVRVTRQLYSVFPNTEHNIYRPQDKVTVEFNAKDANDQPMSVEGTVAVTRNTWREIWLDPAGKEVALDRGQPVTPGEGWRLKKRGYDQETILSRAVKTDDEGKGELVFTPEREGYYQVAWTSEDRDGDPVNANTTVWVATNATTDLGYRSGGLQIIADKDTFRVGQTAAVMLAAPTNDRYVLFSLEGDDLYNCQLVHLTGPVKLVQVPITEQHVPNVFLNAVMVSDRQIYSDTKQVVVPPVQCFLQVEVKADREQYQPREEGTLTIAARDADGKPAATEVALGLVDEAVYYIQQDYAGDPRQFYYGAKRSDYVSTQSSMNQKRYAQLVETEGRLEDVGALRARQTAASEQYFSRTDQSGDKDRLAFADEQSGLEFGRQSRAEAQGLPMREPAGAAGPMARIVGDRMSKGEGGGGEAGPSVTVRSDFRATIFWGPEVKTDKDGTATVKVKFPDSLTGWKAVARAASAGNQFGIADTSVRTKQPLIVRLQAPRFFTVGDVVTISAVINNNTDAEMTVTPTLATLLPVKGIIRDGKVTALAADEAGVYVSPKVTVPANGEARVDWQIAVKTAGDAKLKVIAKADKYADAMEKTYPVYEHGVEKLVARSGKVRGKDVRITLDLPKRKAESTELTVQVAPSLAVTMLDALPYVIDYPYGCTEQTMSRFLPVVITAKTLRDLGLKPEDIAGRFFGGIEGEFADATHPKGKQDLTRLDAMVKQGVNRLYELQHDDGGWGWWKGSETDHYMTAYVVWGLSLAKGAGVAVETGALDRGAVFLRQHLVEEEEHPDMQSWMLFALAAYRNTQRGDLQISDFEKKAFTNLWDNRDHLNAYSRAMFALCAQYYGRTEEARTLARNLVNGVSVDKTPDTSVVMEGEQATNAAVMGIAHWGADRTYWRWSEGGIEATAFALRALLAIDPKNPLVEQSMNWLVKNRRGAQWTNTRDTTFAILALNDYLRATGELAPETEYEMLVNGERVAKQKLTAAEALSAPSRFAVDRKLLKDGPNEIRIRRTGKDDSPLYFSAQAKFVSLEEPVTPAGNEIFVRRAYYQQAGRPTLLKGFVYEQIPLLDNGTVTSGDRVDVVVTVEAKNDYDYLVFEDLKPAGLEAVELRSGENCAARELRADAVERSFVAGKPDRQESDYTGRSRYVYQELRDRKVALFIDHLPQGIWEIRYQLRAEAPGFFHALPVLGHAMYVPEIRCNSAETRMTVTERKE